MKADIFKTASEKLLASVGMKQRRCKSCIVVVQLISKSAWLSVHTEESLFIF